MAEQSFGYVQRHFNDDYHNAREIGADSVLTWCGLTVKTSVIIMLDATPHTPFCEECFEAMTAAEAVREKVYPLKAPDSE